MPSKPVKEKHRIVAPVIIGIHAHRQTRTDECSPAYQRLHLKYAINNHAQNHRDQHYLQHTITVLKFATDFRLRRLKAVIRPPAPPQTSTMGWKAPELQIDFRQQNVDHRREQIVEQRRQPTIKPTVGLMDFWA